MSLSLGFILWYSLTVPTVTTRLWSSLRNQEGGMVREFDGRELISMIAGALKETGR